MGELAITFVLWYVPVTSSDVALSSWADGAGPLSGNVIAGLEVVLESSVTVIHSLVDENFSETQGVLLGGRKGDGEQAGEDSLQGKQHNTITVCHFRKLKVWEFFRPSPNLVNEMKPAKDIPFAATLSKRKVHGGHSRMSDVRFFYF